MKAAILIIFTLLSFSQVYSQTRYKSNDFEVAEWNYFEKKWDVTKRTYVPEMEILLDKSTIRIGKDIKLTIIEVDKSVEGIEYNLDSWIVWGDRPSDILKFTIARYKNSKDIVFSMMNTKILLRWYSKQ